MEAGHTLNRENGRIQSIDVLRGFALLGLLSMNIISFSMPDIAYYNPTAVLADVSLNTAVFSLSYVFADQKFMAIFSLLFGASTLLILDKAKATMSLHFKRNAWLILFGLLHGVLLWEGDVLVIYGICALFLYFLRNLSASTQLILGLIFFLMSVEYNIVMAWLVPQLDMQSLQWLTEHWMPSAQSIAKDITLYQGSFSEQFFHRLNGSPTGVTVNDGSDLHGLGQLIDFFGRSFGMMLIGMAAYKTRVIAGSRSENYYANMCLIGFGLGVPLAVAGLYLLHANEWHAVYALFAGRIPNQFATLFIAMGYVGMVNLIVQRGLFRRWQYCLSAVGKTALSNYIGQTILASFVFYGFGLGLYAQVGRVGLVFIMLLIWLIQISLSIIWLRYFRYGPLEWLWRSLSQGFPARMIL